MELQIMLMLGTFFVLLIVGFPVAIAIAASGFVFGFTGFEGKLFALVPHRIYGVISKYEFIAIPLFVFMGVALERSRIAEDLLTVIGYAMGGLRGGLGIAIVLCGVLLGAATGIVGATIVTLTLLTLPILLAWGYSKSLSCGLICASGTLGQIIPPSLVLILMADIVGLSVGTLFADAFVPGLLLAVLFVGYLLMLAVLKPDMVPAIEAEERATVDGKKLLKQMVFVVLPPMTLVVFVLGFFMEWVEISYIALPIMLPFFQSVGVDMVWLAMLIAVILQTSFLTPPFGWSLFFLQGVAPPEIRMKDIYIGVLPFIGIQLLVVALVFVFSDLVLWLPRLIGW